MNEPSETINRTLVFIGAPRAGKTCLMAAWFNYLNDAENLLALQAYEADVEGEAKIFSVWEAITQRGAAPDQTPVGLPNVNSVTFRYGGRQYCFQFHDYSGETVTKAFTGELKDPELESQVISTCRNADKLFLVINLQDYLSESSNSLKDVLVFLNQVTQRHEFKTLFEHGVTVYLSHPEMLSKAELSECVRDIQAKVRKPLPSFPYTAFIQGSAVTESGDQQIAFTKPSDRFSPKRHFDEVFADLVVISKPSAENLVTKSLSFPFSSRRRQVVSAALVLLAVGFGVFFNLYRQEQLQQKWEAYRLVFADYAATDISDPRVASGLIPEVKAWAETASQEYEKFYLRDEYDTKVAVFLGELKQIQEIPPRDVEDVMRELRDLHGEHGSNYRRLFPAIQSSAERALSNSPEWSSRALNEWRQIRSFIETLQAGVYIALTPSFWFDENWNLQVEFHIYDQQHSQPYGEASLADGNLEGIQFDVVSNPIRGSDRHRFLWREEGTSNKLFQPERDRIDLRVVRHRWWKNGQIHADRLHPAGIHVFALLDDEFEHKTEHGTFVINLTGYRLLNANHEEVKIPRIIKDASR